MIAKRHLKRISTAMAQCDSLSNSYDDLINLSLGDPDLTTDERIINAAFEDAKNGHTHYTDFLGDRELRKEICSIYNTNIDNCMVTTSGCHGMWLVLESILDEGDQVIIPEPFFTPYPQQVELARGVPVFHKTLEREHFHINIQRLESQITEKTKAIILNTPNNPTGACQPLHVLKGLAKISREKNILIIADDIYTAYHYNSPFIPMHSLLDNCITVSSFSKDYCMTGWRIGYVIAPKELISTMKDINESNVFTAPSISQRAALFALKNRDIIQPNLIKVFKERMDYAYERISHFSNLKVLPPQGSIYMFVNISSTGMDSDSFTKYILEESHILVLPGSAFGESGKDYIRIALTVGIDKLKIVFDRLEKLKILGGNYV